MPEISSEDEALDKEFFDETPFSEDGEPFLDEIKNVNSWDNFKWKVVEPYIKAINNQPRTTQNFILLGIFIVAPISFSYLHGLGSWLFNLTLMNFNLHFVGCVFLIIVLGGCMYYAYSCFRVE